MAERVAAIGATMTRSGTQYPLGNLVADAQRWSAKTDVAVMNNGGVRADLRAGTATFGDLFEVQPFGNTLFRYTVTGDALRAYLERIVGHARLNAHVSGVIVRYDSRRPAGQRIVSLALADGRSVTDSATYTISMNDFMVTGGDGLDLGTKAQKLEDLRTVDLDALAAYLRSRTGAVQPPAEPRLIDVAAGENP